MYKWTCAFQTYVVSGSILDASICTWFRRWKGSRSHLSAALTAAFGKHCCGNSFFASVLQWLVDSFLWAVRWWRRRRPGQCFRVWVLASWGIRSTCSGGSGNLPTLRLHPQRCALSVNTSRGGFPIPHLLDYGKAAPSLEARSVATSFSLYNYFASPQLSSISFPSASIIR